MHAYRRTRCIAFLLLALFSFGAYRAGAGQEHSSDLQLIVNDVHLPVFFEDQTLTDSEKDVIVADCQFLLDQLSPEGRRPLRSRVIQQEEGAVRITSALLYSAKAYKRPRATRNQLGIIGTLDDGQECVVIQKKLSDEYKAAMALKKANEEAYRSLPQFVALLNDLTEKEMPAVEDFFYLPGATKKDSEELASAPKQKVVEEYRRFRYTRTSILELRRFEGKLMTTVYAKNKDDAHLYQRLVIYDDGRWKIVFVTPGT